MCKYNDEVCTFNVRKKQKINIMNILARLMRRARWEYYKWSDFVYKHFCFTPYIMQYDECIDYINKYHASIARMGDGELICMFGTDLRFQNSTKELREQLKKVCIADSNNCLLGIPDAFEHLERYIPVEQSFWKSHFYFHRRQWYTFLKKGKKYANTYISRFYSMEYNKQLSEKRISKLMTLWADRDVIFIEGKDSKLGVGNDMFDNVKSIHRIIAPSKNAFDKYDKLISTAKKVATPNCLFIIALGPTATVLAYDLSEAVYQALDMGHFDIEYEWFKMGATSKVPVTGKFSNEAAILSNTDSEVIGELKSNIYEQQIIATVL